jgi:hypothetical protein
VKWQLAEVITLKMIWVRVQRSTRFFIATRIGEYRSQFFVQAPYARQIDELLRAVTVRKNLDSSSCGLHVDGARGARMPCIHGRHSSAATIFENSSHLRLGSWQLGQASFLYAALCIIIKAHAVWFVAPRPSGMIPVDVNDILVRQ